MKAINKQGKILGKVHIFDVIIIALLIAIIIGSLDKLSGDNIVSLGTTVEKTVEFTVQTAPYEDQYFNNLQVGDILAEEKKYLDGEITGIEIIDYMVSDIDNNGVEVIGPHPSEKIAIVNVKAVVDYKEPIYKLGKQEIREGALIFLTTELTDLSVVVTDFKEVE